MAIKKRHRFWNVLIVLTLIICALAFIVHYKNWTKIGSDSVHILSGAYYRQIKFSELDSIRMVAKIPPMERINGFSALEKEKGVFREFKDSLTDKKVYVYVDNLSYQKIKLVYRDSLNLYMNLKDSTETHKLFDFLKDKIDMFQAETLPEGN